LLFEKEAPDPIGPLRLDDQDRKELSEPSCVSIAVPENVTELPLVELAPFAGEVIVTTGGVFEGEPEFTVNVIDELPLRLPLSVTLAVIV
jgi:hypothetical protein